jgi:hypothetical protein
VVQVIEKSGVEERKGDYTVDKAEEKMSFVLGQAGVSENLRIPDGLTAEDLESAETLVLEWKEDGHYRAIDLVVTLFERLTESARARQSGAR